mgnify:CR=1 FL=1|jgi:hypothetical protein
MKAATIELDRVYAASLKRIQVRSAFFRNLVRYATVTLACVSVLVMGSESQWFPWPNLSAGAVLFFIAWRVNR